MPAVPSNGLVLLTGASGFLAAHVGKQLLERGYTVRGTVRSSEKGDYLKKLYQKDGLNKFEYVIVEDVEKDGGFDEAVKGVDGVAHTASPFHFNVSDPHEDLINPAVHGTRNLLSSAAKEPKIKRVVVTSSFAAVVNPHDPVYTFTEEDWNTDSPKQVEEKGKSVDPSVAYRASKTLAEKAAWDFVKEQKTSFDLATVNPPYIFGPIIHQVKDAKSLNTSVNLFYKYLLGEMKDEDAVNPSGSFIDVRDVATIHIDALATEEAGQKRFLASNASFSFQELLDIVHKHPELIKAFPKTIKGAQPGMKTPKQNLIDASRAKKLFGWEPITTEKMVVDMANSLAERQREW